jgi:hypothetical protein
VRFVQLFLNSEKGDYEHMEFLEYYKCKVVKMEPLDPKNTGNGRRWEITKVTGHISIDGHVMDFSSAEISVNRGMVNMLFK